MIGLSTKEFDLSGSFIFYEKDLLQDDDTTKTIVRRISKSKTLDPGVFIDDSGYIPGDTDLEITVIRPTEETYLELIDVFKYHPFVIVTTKYGNFLCVPSTLKMTDGNAILTLATQSSA